MSTYQTRGSILRKSWNNYPEDVTENTKDIPMSDFMLRTNLDAYTSYARLLRRDSGMSFAISNSINDFLANLKPSEFDLGVNHFIQNIWVQFDYFYKGLKCLEKSYEDDKNFVNLIRCKMQLYDQVKDEWLGSIDDEGKTKFEKFVIIRKFKINFETRYEKTRLHIEEVREQKKLKDEMKKYHEEIQTSKPVEENKSLFKKYIQKLTTVQ